MILEELLQPTMDEIDAIASRDGRAEGVSPASPIWIS